MGYKDEKPPRDCIELVGAGTILFLLQGSSFCRKTRPIRVGTRVGRNDLCPCGSGIKHKHCCVLGGEEKTDPLALNALLNFAAD